MTAPCLQRPPDLVHLAEVRGLDRKLEQGRHRIHRLEPAHQGQSSVLSPPPRNPDAVSADHDLNAYIQLLGRDGNLTLVGAPEKPLPVSAFGLLFARRSLSGSLIGDIAETQEMFDFCGEKNITADVEVIPIQKINEAYERMLTSDVKYRFSIAMASLRAE